MWEPGFISNWMANPASTGSDGSGGSGEVAVKSVSGVKNNSSGTSTGTFNVAVASGDVVFKSVFTAFSNATLPGDHNGWVELTSFAGVQSASRFKVWYYEVTTEETLSCTTSWTGSTSWTSQAIVVSGLSSSWAVGDFELVQSNGGLSSSLTVEIGSLIIAWGNWRTIGDKTLTGDFGTVLDSQANSTSTNGQSAVAATVADEVDPAIDWTSEFSNNIYVIAEIQP